MNVDHLPVRKKAELARIVDILHEEFPDKISSATSDHRKQVLTLKIILFRSYGRGDLHQATERGYLKARSSGHYEITREELASA